MGQSWPLFVYFRSFLQHFYRKIADVSGIRTRIVRVEGEQTDHLTSTTTDHFFNTYFPFSHYSDNVIPACASLPLSGQVKFILYKVVAALLTAWLLLIQEDQGSNPVIGKFYRTIDQDIESVNLRYLFAATIAFEQFTSNFCKRDKI